MKKLFVILLCIVAPYLQTAKAQNYFTKRDSIAKAFITSVFIEKKTTRFVMDNYMNIETREEIPIAKKEAFIDLMLDTLVKANGKLLISSTYQIFSYDRFKGAKKKFNGDDTKGILIVAVDNEAIFYLAFKKNRIISTLTFQKGSVAYFAVM